MTRSTHSVSELVRALRLLALRYPEVEEGIACQGTALECSTFKAGSKAFLFIGAGELRFKLGDSLAEATQLSAKSPELYAAGAHGWVKVTLSKNPTLPAGLLERWIDESYRLLATKKLVALLDATKKPPSKKKSRQSRARPRG